MRLPSHVEVEAIVTGSNPEKDNFFSSVEAVATVLCGRLAG